MSDAGGGSDGAAPDDGATVKRSTVPAAAAASRARRIGGRATPATRPARAATGDRARSDPPATHDEPPAANVPDAAVPPAVAAPAAKVSTTKAAAMQAAITKDSTAAASGPVAPAPVPGSRRDPSAMVRWAPAVVLIVAALVMAVVVVVSTHGSRWDRPSTASVRDQVLAAAKSCVVATNTYSYKDLTAFRKKGLACGSGQFTKDFTASLTKVLDVNAPKIKQVQSFKVNNAGIAEVTAKDVWTVLIYGEVQVTNAGYPDGRTDPYGAIATMKKIGGTWKLIGLDTVCSSVLISSGNACK